MKDNIFLGALLLMATLFASAGCVSTRESERRVDVARKAELERCRQDLDRMAAECASLTDQDAPFFDRGGFGAKQGNQ